VKLNKILDLKCKTNGIAVKDGKIYFGNSGGYGEIYCINESGEVAWGYTTNRASVCAPLVGNDSVYSLHEEGCLYVLTLGGIAKAHHDYEGRIDYHCPPIAGTDGRIYMGGKEGAYSLLTPMANGSLFTFVKDFYIGNNAESEDGLFSKEDIFPATAPNGYVYFASWGGNILGISCQNGENYKFRGKGVGIDSLRKNVCSPIAVGEKMILFINGDNLYSINFALEPSSCNLINDCVYSITPVISSYGSVYCKRYENKIYLFAIAAGGGFLWEKLVAHPLVGLITDNDVIYAIDLVGQILAINAENGEKKDKCKIEKGAYISAISAPPVMGDDGKIYLLANNNKVYIIEK